MRTDLSVLAEPECAGCHRSKRRHAGGIVRLQQYWFHAYCAPTCRVCQRRLGPVDDERWIYQANIESSAWGYAVEPTTYWCRNCWDAGSHDDPPALD